MIIWEIFSAIRIKANHRLLHFAVVDDMPADLHGDYTESTMLCRINANFSEWDRHHTGFHEYLHAVSDAYDINLTEDQVTKLELAVSNTYRYNIGFSLDPSVRKK